MLSKKDTEGLSDFENGNKKFSSFAEAKIEFDRKYRKTMLLEQSIVPVNGKIVSNINLKDVTGQPNEEYYKWQFVYALIESRLSYQDYIGVEVYFPKGNKNSAPLKIDACIFDDKNWIEEYSKWVQDSENYESLSFLRLHLIATIEFKRGKDNIERTFSTQLRPAMKESDLSYTIGIIYDKERLYLFQKENGIISRYDNAKNAGNGTSLSLDLPDPYSLLPEFKKITAGERSKKGLNFESRTVKELDMVSGRSSTQLENGLNQILRVLEKHSMVDQEGYRILIQAIALKIFDEKRSANTSSLVDWFIGEDERNFKDLSDEGTKKFIKRFEKMYQEASNRYFWILKNRTIDWKSTVEVEILQTIVLHFQDFALTRSYNTDLYQLVFYNFAQEFQKQDNAQFLTPIPLIEFLVKIVNPRGKDSVFDPCLGIGDFLSLSFVNSNPKLEDQNLWGTDVSPKMIALAELNMLLNGDGNARLLGVEREGSITQKISTQGNIVTLSPSLHKYNEVERVANWDNWLDYTKLMKFNVILTNPPFGQGRPFEIRTQKEREIMDMYETYHIKNEPKSMDKGVLFLENAYHVLDEYGRLGIVLSNAIASEQQWESVRRWFLEKMRLVALFDLPPNVFAETGVNTSLIVAYKPPKSELDRLRKNNYAVFAAEITKIGYQKRTKKRNVIFEPVYKIDPITYEVEINEDGSPVLDEQFTDTLQSFRRWARSQEEALQRLFL